MKKLIAILMAVVSLMCGGISAMADSHNWDSGKWLRLPTCKVTGLKLLQCTNDGCNATTKVTVARVIMFIWLRPVQKQNGANGVIRLKRGVSRLVIKSQKLVALTSRVTEKIVM